MKKVLTLCLIVDENKILLGMKKRGFGEGRWNGFGGKVEEGESIEEAAKREVLEEVGINVKDLNKKGVIDFEFLNDNSLLEVHIFKACDYSGSPVETEEMKPQWFDILDIPFSEMWPDDLYWLPLFLKNKNFKGKFIFEDKNKIISHDLEILND
ncbi:MAG: 8-oxo-dGTP diphosphatase [Candidatus Pacebacteria bacterium]|nr:8-oxo-dGTP diphosphatase [Candidatus Paceibacterota bacterium]MDD5012931.1 8-oxo-dGTP diphosphatase [Candidatus Paceibacterota bacterium]MDD5752515.1 8-oxo-dGTP diphosphatase [Candidatus Paceibacterota bacterium]